MTPVGTGGQFTGADFGGDDLLYARTAEDFVRGEVLPRLEAIEAKEEGLMPALLKRAGELGLLMIDIPERYGGLGLRKTTSMLVSERSALCASFSVSLGAHTGIGSLPLVYYGTEAQKERYLPKLATGEWLAAYALMEPQAGSDRARGADAGHPRAGGRELSPDGHQAVHHQRRLRRPVHRLRQDRRREVHRLPRRARRRA
jgi:butyryl-CoA dehydrogenase